MSSNEPEDAQSQDQDFGASMGYRLAESADGLAVVELKILQRHRNRWGTVHGGVILTLMDAAGLWSGAYRDGLMLAASSVSVTCNFVRAATGDRLRAHAQVSKLGRAFYFSDLRVTSVPDDTLVATGTGVFAFSPDGKSMRITADNPMLRTD